MRELNREHRQKDKPTDVLSFPLWESSEMFAAPDAPIFLGDLVISIETAVRQAGELKHFLQDEIAFLAIHGVLHLLGYDHGDDKSRRVMFGLQDGIFEGMKAV